jgi:acetylornithine/N-succinyldiaminopimelate aminotransferase
MPFFEFVPFNDCEAIRKALDDDTAAVIIEPIQGEGGVRVPEPDYLEIVSGYVNSGGIIMLKETDRFFRTGPAFINAEKG